MDSYPGNPEREEGDGLEELPLGPVVPVPIDVIGSEAFAEALRLESPNAFTATALYLYLFCFAAFLCSTMNGYDGSLLAGLLQVDQFKSYFNGTSTGRWVGIVSFSQEIGGILSVPFTGPVLDILGRKKGILVGVILVIIGATFQAAATYTHSLNAFIAGRFLVGLGAQFAGTAAPIYITEICHPASRGVMTGLYNTFWYSGSVIASGAIRGSLCLVSAGSWRFPIWLQWLCPGIVMVTATFLPESPRWLYVNSYKQEAKVFIVKYHGAGAEDSRWVRLQIREYESLKNGGNNHWWDYRSLLQDRSSRYRVTCAMTTTVFGQWTGNVILQLLLSAVLDSAGVHGEVAQTNINVSLSITQLVSAVIGASLLDRAGRRPILILTNVSLATIWLALATATADHDRTGSMEAARTILVFIYIFDIVFAFGFTPMQVLYPVEILSYEMRAKGLALSGLCNHLANLINQFAWPVAIAKIGWKIYIITMLWCLFQALIVYVFFPETKGRTLEQLDEIFQALNPRKFSTHTHLSRFSTPEV